MVGGVERRGRGGQGQRIWQGREGSASRGISAIKHSTAWSASQIQSVACFCTVHELQMVSAYLNG